MKKNIFVTILGMLLIIIIITYGITYGTIASLLLAQKINPLSLNIMHYYKYDLKIRMADWKDEEKRFSIDKGNYLFTIKYKSYNNTLKINKFQKVNEISNELLIGTIAEDKTISKDPKLHDMILKFSSTSTHFFYKEKQESKIFVLYNENEQILLILEIYNL